MLLEEPFPATLFFGQLQDFDFYGDESVKVTRVEVEASRMPKEVLYIPAILLLLVVIFHNENARLFRRSSLML